VTVPATLPEVAAALDEVLGDGVARTAAECAKLLVDRGLDLGRDPLAPVEELLDSDELRLVMPVSDDRHVSLPALLAGRVFTHHLTEAELAGGFLSTTPDLEALCLLTEDDVYCHLVDGSEIDELLPGFDDELLAERGIAAPDVNGAAWLLPPDLLSGLGLTAGAIVGVSVAKNGLAIAPVVPGTPPDDVVTALRTWAERLADVPEQVDTVLWELCLEDTNLFRTPLPPVTDLFELAGLSAQDELVMPTGFDLAAYRVERRAARVAELHGLDEDEALAVLAISRMYEQVADVVEHITGELEDGEALQDVVEELGLTDGAPALEAPAEGPPVVGDGKLVRDLLHLLADPAVASAVLAETLGTDREGAAALGVFADSLEPLAPSMSRASVRWLRGKALDRLGDPLGAEAAFEAALTLDPSHLLALYDLARLASDRGEAERGLSLLRRADAPADDELVVLLQHFQPAERTDIGRNERCWCGSGRKYKVCHRNREQLPLAERAAWLYQKAGMYLQDGPRRTQILDLARIRARHWPSEQALLAALQDPLVADSVMFEGGAFAQFLDERGVLLPDDERLLAAQWLLHERSLFELEEVQPGSGFTARDLRTGGRVAVRERLGSRQLRVGTLVCARLVPAGDTVQCFGGLEVVDLFQRDGLLALLDDEPEPSELVGFLSARFAPPTLQNTEGEPLMLCEAALRSPDPQALSAALDRTYQRSDDATRWHEFVTTHGTERIRATISLVEADVTVETNSDIRQDRVLEKLRRLQPDLEIIHETRRPIEDAQEAMNRAPGRHAASVLDPSDPAVAAALEGVILDQERAWLDEPIPALDGATPREAALDPTRRDDLVRLLDSFGHGGRGTMKPRRLRSALGLD